MIRALLLAAAACAAVPAAAQLRADKRADLTQPVVLGPGQGAIVVGFRRPDKMSAGKSGAFGFGRYDVTARDLILQPKAAKKAGDTTTYTVLARSADKKQVHELAVMLVSAGDYVATGALPGPGGIIMNSFCLGAPTFRVAAGEAVYFGDVTPYFNVKLKSGARTAAMAYSSNVEAAKVALANQPALAAALKPAAISNAATYACYGQAMLAYAVPGAPDLPPAGPAAPALPVAAAAATP